MNRSRFGVVARLGLVVASLALLTFACGGSTSAGAGKAAATVTIKNIAFQPDSVQISTGQTVTWRFDDASVPHTVTAGDGSFDSGTKTSGQFSHRFDKPGTYEYSCTVHPQQMRAKVVVS